MCATRMDKNVRDAQETLTFYEVQHRVIGELTLCDFTYIMIIGTDYLKECGTTTSTRYFKCGSSFPSDLAPHLEKDVNDDQAPLNASPLTDQNIRVALLNMAQAITSQTHDATTQDQAMMTHANREVVHMSKKQITTMTF